MALFDKRETMTHKILKWGTVIGIIGCVGYYLQKKQKINFIDTIQQYIPNSKQK